MVVLAEQFSRYRERLHRVVEVRIDPRLSARVDPEDVLQEAWLSAAKRISYFLDETELPVFVWLRLIVVQTLIDTERAHRRAKARSVFRERPLASIDQGQASTAEPLVKLLVSLSTPSQDLLSAEASARLYDAIQQMDRIDREVLVMRHFEELTNQEVAATLNLKLTAASNRYRRALARLKALLEAMPNFVEEVHSEDALREPGADETNPTKTGRPRSERPVRIKRY